MFKMWIILVCVSGKCLVPETFETAKECRDYLGYIRVNIERDKPYWVPDASIRCVQMQEIEVASND